MHFMIFLILFYHTTLALIYNDVCTNKCDLPGLICVNNRCICDFKARLFWTNIQCISCPNNWIMTETACIIYYETAMSWINAKLTCRNMKAELISFHNKDLISLMYTATDRLTAWTSAHATDLSELGVYQWLDKNLISFNSKSDWWCKTTTLNLGYSYKYDEPTRSTYMNNETEACVVYWRGITNTEVLCLDDQLCSREFPFVCEISESTISFNRNISDRASVIHNIPSNVQTVVINTNFRKSKQAVNSIGPLVIILIIIFLVLLVLFGGLFFFLKRRKIIDKIRFNRNPVIRNKAARPISKKSVTNINDSIINKESINSDTNTSEISVALENESVPVNTAAPIDLSKQQTNKRSGYSKQQFDEFE